MATLHVRNVPDEVYEALRERAEKEGRSIGGETVALLQEALGAKEHQVRTVRRRFRRLPRRELKPGERLGPRARRVLVTAQQEARALRHGYIGTEHLLLGLLREEGPAARVLREENIDVEATRARVADVVGEGDEAAAGPYPFTPRAKKVLEFALREALEVGSDLMEPEHVLVALAREGEGLAAEILEEHGLDVSRLRGLTMAHGGVHFTEPPSHLEPFADAQWEYRAIALQGGADEWTRLLNDVAKEGWELVQVLPGGGAVFRRRRNA